jgi:hypothetical protein
VTSQDTGYLGIVALWFGIIIPVLLLPLFMFLNILIKIDTTTEDSYLKSSD